VLKRALTSLRAVLMRTPTNLRPVLIMALTGLRAVLTRLSPVLKKALTRLRAVLTRTLYLVAGRRISERFCGVRVTRNFDRHCYMVFQCMSDIAALDSGIHTQPPDGLWVLPSIMCAGGTTVGA